MTYKRLFHEEAAKEWRNQRQEQAVLAKQEVVNAAAKARNPLR